MPTPLLSFYPSTTIEEALKRAAESWDIETEYWDIWGTKHHATTEGIGAVLSSLGVDCSSAESLDRAIEQRLWDAWARPLPVTCVMGVDHGELALRLPIDVAGADIELAIEWEDGSRDLQSVELAPIEVRAAAELRGQRFVEKAIPMPGAGHLGYHQLSVLMHSEVLAVTRLILCPERAYMPPALAIHKRTGGLAVSLYGIRSERNWGCGDFTDLKAFATWAAKAAGVGFVGLNPLHAIPNRLPYNTSPYLPACSFYKNPIYLDVEAVEDFRGSALARRIVGSDAFRERAGRLRSAEFVEYEEVYGIKKRLLKLLFRTFLAREYRRGTERAEAFAAYVREQGELLDQYAVYCALDEAIHRSHPDVWLWTDWPEEYRDPESAATRAFASLHWRSVLFHKYLQWQIDLQLADAQSHAKDLGMPIGLYHDLALATDRFGSDLWAHRRFYVNGCRVGSPPDGFAPDGQDWSFPPPNSESHLADGYRLFAESIRKNLRHGGALRIDHVMRFFHLFWIPNTLPAKLGIYVRDRHEDLIRILALESVRNQVLVVGEDLGTVSDEIRETLHRFGILSYRLFFFEKGPDGRPRMPHEYPEQSIVSASTHDLPTLAGFWEASDIEARRRVGMVGGEAGYRRQIEERHADKQKMLDALFAFGLLPSSFSRSVNDYPALTGELHHAIVGFLASTPSMLMVLNEEDLMKQPDQQNLPGTCEEYPNWRHKTRFTIEELSTKPAMDFAGMYKGWLESSGRLGYRK